MEGEIMREIDDRWEDNDNPLTKYFILFKQP